jgi:hypothetical protein
VARSKPAGGNRNTQANAHANTPATDPDALTGSAHRHADAATTHGDAHRHTFAPAHRNADADPDFYTDANLHPHAGATHGHAGPDLDADYDPDACDSGREYTSAQAID